MPSTSRFVSATLLVFTLARAAVAAEPAAETRFQLFKRRSDDAEKAGLAEPFRGITTNGTVAPGVFAIRSTGVSTEPVRRAAVAFLASLSAAERAKTVFPVDDPEWRKWMNQDFYVRQGIGFRDMGESQRAAAFGLMRAALSAKGMKLSQDIMKLNHTLGELNQNDFERYDETLYWVTVMGEPSKDKPWGWQVDGHHLVLNYFVLGDQVVMSPCFFGSEPVTAPSGKYQGTTILADEQARGLKMIRSLDDAQRKKAVLASAKPGNNNLTEAFKDNAVVDYAGIRGAELTAAQREELVSLVGVYAANMDDGHARVKLDEVRAHLDETRFAWVGGTEDNSVFYYRIHSPVVLIEFDHQRPINLRHLATDPNAPTQQHIHIVVRTPNGNDYGKDLLRQHLLQHPH